MSAILLPLLESGDVDWQGFDDHVLRTWDAGLIPAVNMDTGYAHLIGDALRTKVLQRTSRLASGRKFVSGAFVGDGPGADFQADAYRSQVDQIQSAGGLPIVFQSHGLTSLPNDRLLEAYSHIGRSCDRFLAFELGTMFAPFGKIYSLDTYRGLLQIPQCMGAKHSSLDRQLEWERLQLRDQVRPDFVVLTGNDLAIDMVFYGSDYLLGLSTFAPDYFGLRDRWWRDGDPRAIALNDWLQYLGFFAFRPPVPAYKHSAAQFLKLRGWIATSKTFTGSPARPDTDVAVLEEILRGLNSLGTV
jgi:dihydrodipicolinate synthase/N-acetylneuraminate lyase